MVCVTSVTYVVLINGQPNNIIKPTRGIRHGNPISLYLFLICAEGISSLLNVAEKT